MTRVVDPSEPLSYLQQRLRYAAQAVPDPLLFADNVPQWPGGLATSVTPSEHASRYVETRGLDELIDEICRRERRRRGWVVSPDNVLVTHGALHAVSLIARASAGPGAVALCQKPVLRSIAEMLASYGYRVVLMAADEPPGRIVERQRAVGATLLYLNSPHNPTGHLVPTRQLAVLVSAARAWNCTVVLDSVYDEFVFDEHGDPAAWPPELGLEEGRFFVVDSLSKAFGAPGLRVGWLLGSRQSTSTLAAALERECICGNGAAQWQAAGLLRTGNHALVEAVEQGRAILRGLAAPAASEAMPLSAGGPHAWWRLPVDDVEAFADELLVRHGLVLATAANFVGTDGPFVRIPTGCAPSTLTRAMTLLARALREHGTPATWASSAPGADVAATLTRKGV